MTKKHFEAIARIIKSQRDDLVSEQPACGDAYNVLIATAANMADYFASENPRFNREKFLTACGF